MRCSTRHGLRTSRGVTSGFTLIELVTVMTVLLIVSATAVAALGEIRSRRSGALRMQLINDLTYARGMAMNTGVRTWVVFASDGFSYQILSEPVGAPGRANAAALRDPATNGTMTRILNSGEFAGVSVTSVSFDGAREVGFAWDGTPQNSAQADLAATGTVGLTGGGSLSVMPVTGIVR